MNASIRPQQRNRIFQLLNRLGLSEERKAILQDRYKVTSINDLSFTQAQNMIKWLEQETGETESKSKWAARKKKEVSKTQKAIVHYLCTLGMVTPDDKPDRSRIDAFIRNIGSRNPEKKGLFELDETEQNLILTQIKAMTNHEFERLKNKL